MVPVPNGWQNVLSAIRRVANTFAKKVRAKSHPAVLPVVITIAAAVAGVELPEFLSLTMMETTSGDYSIWNIIKYPDSIRFDAPKR